MNAMHDITESGSTSLDVVAGPIGDALVATAIVLPSLYRCFGL